MNRLGKDDFGQALKSYKGYVLKVLIIRLNKYTITEFEYKYTLTGEYV